MGIVGSEGQTMSANSKKLLETANREKIATRDSKQRVIRDSK